MLLCKIVAVVIFHQFLSAGHSYITGIDSYHDNGHEDRRFKFRCCELTGNITLTRLCNILRIMRLQKRYRVTGELIDFNRRNNRDDGSGHNHFNMFLAKK